MCAIARYTRVMFGVIADVWAELIAVVVAAAMGWWSKHFLDRKRNNDRNRKPSK